MLSPLRRLLPAPPSRLSPAAGAAPGLARQPMPFGVAIAAGGLWVLGRHWLIIH
jgi:prepilin peptidase CpaA